MAAVSGVSNVSSATCVNVTLPLFKETTTALKAWTQNGILYINGLTRGEPWSVYSLTGSLIYTGIETGSEMTLALPVRGSCRFFLCFLSEKSCI